MGDSSPPWDVGRVQVYTGDGKGKTTAALGLAVRAAGAGIRVLIIQFAKPSEASEHRALARFAELITVRQFGGASFIVGEPGPEDIAAAREGLELARQALASGDPPLVILDEANIAVHFGLFTIEELLAAIDARAPHVEVIVTGRRAHPTLVERADLVTEMREVKHYYDAGVRVRRGIEA